MKTLLIATAEWCHYCQKFKPVLEQLKNYVKVIHLDSSTDANLIAKHNEDIKDLINNTGDLKNNLYPHNYDDMNKFEVLPKYMIKGYPTILLLKDYKIVARYNGERTLEKIIAFVRSY
jgi:thiol-disulfide isomerase/thioredoxin